MLLRNYKFINMFYEDFVELTKEEITQVYDNESELDLYVEDIMSHPHVLPIPNIQQLDNVVEVEEEEEEEEK